MLQENSRTLRSQKLLGAMLLVLGSIGLTGCVSAPVASYQPSVENVQALKVAVKNPVAVGTFTGGAKTISVRGSSAKSAVGNSYGEYVQAALSSELEKAQLLLPASNLHVRGNVVETDIDAAMGTGKTSIATEFVVSKNGVEKYRKTISAQYSWESSFVGAVAIPRAFETYPKVVEQLLKELYADPDFIKALM